MRSPRFLAAIVLLLGGGALIGYGLFSGGGEEAPEAPRYVERARCEGCPVPLESVEVQDREGSTLFVVRGTWPDTVADVPGDVRLAANGMDLVLRPDPQTDAFQLVSGPDPAAVAAGLQRGALLINLADGTLDSPIEFVVGVAEGDRFTSRLPAEGALVWDGEGAPRPLPNAEGSPAPAGSPPTEPEEPAETPEEFTEALVDAIRTGDATFLLERLHPAVLDIYGRRQCRTYVRGIRDPGRMYQILEVGQPEPWDYEIDGRTTTIPDAVAVLVEATAAGSTDEQELHFAPAGEGYSWFTDCGEPLS